MRAPGIDTYGQLQVGLPYLTAALTLNLALMFAMRSRDLKMAPERFVATHCTCDELKD